MRPVFACIEAGGTKFNCAIVDAQRKIHAELRVPTTTPNETLDACIAFFRECKQKGANFDSLGIGSFGPLDLDTQSKSHGYITSTPKPNWSDVPLKTYLASSLDCDVKIDTDVNAAALAEYRWGAAQHCQVAVYITVGTGVGGGVVINGKPLHGLVHPEIGHMHVGEVDNIQGVCPFHGSCVEGLASGTSLGKIWQTPAESLPQDHQAWDVQAKVLAKLSHNLIVTLSAQKIVFGGGVMQQDFLLDNVRRYTSEYLANYVRFATETTLADIIVAPGLADRSGLFGALALVLPE